MPHTIDYQYLLPSGYLVTIYGYRTNCPDIYWIQTIKRNPYTEESRIEYHHFVTVATLDNMLRFYEQRAVWSSHQRVGTYLLPYNRAYSSDLTDYYSYKKNKI